MTLLLSALAFIFLITSLILVHELGHFLAARFFRITVEEFGFGLPPRFVTLFTRAGTHFTVNWIPFGGFVRLKGENATEAKASGERGSFVAASVPARVIVLVAGVAMNLALAFVFLTYGFSYGRWIPTYLSLDAMQRAATQGEIALELAVSIDDVLPGGTAAKARVSPGMLLLEVDGVSVRKPNDVVALQEGKTRVHYTLAIGENFSEMREIAVAVRDGKTGVMLSAIPRVLEAPRRKLLQGCVLALREVGMVTRQTFSGIGQLFKSLLTSGTVPEGVTGIVGIAQLTHTSVQEGWEVYLRLVALLSLSLAILNILPFPALDGGRLLFVLIEIVMRRAPNRTFELAVNTVGFTFLLLIILLVTFYDVVRLFS
jgi:regulator of sigma E protease